MNIVPIVRSFLRHKIIVALLVVEVAITTGLSCNVIHLATAKAQSLIVPSGIAEDQLSIIDSVSLDSKASYVVTHAADLEALRKIPGVIQVAAVDSVPLGKNNWTLPIKSAPPSASDGVLRKPSIYTGTPGSLQALGLKLIAGRDFVPGEYQPVGSTHGYDGVIKLSSAIVSKQLAEDYFPDGSALGRDLYLPNGHEIHIIGIVAHLLRPQITQADDAEDSLFMPLLPDQNEVLYAFRTNSADSGRVLKAAQIALAKVDSRRLIQFARPFSEIRESYFSADKTMLELLCAAGAGLIFIAVVSIGGLASFWVMQRKRQIGIRRALGATKADIRAYFQLENLLLVGTGAALGLVLAPFLSGAIMKLFEAPALPVIYLPVAAILFCVIGQFSVLAPAIAAARLPPVYAMSKR
jgi:putative ABC transport system permease protein